MSSLDLLGGQKVTELDKAAASRGFPGSVNNTAKGRRATIQTSQRGVEQIWFKLPWERKCLHPSSLLSSRLLKAPDNFLPAQRPSSPAEKALSTSKLFPFSEWEAGGKAWWNAGAGEVFWLQGKQKEGPF